MLPSLPHRSCLPQALRPTRPFLRLGITVKRLIFALFACLLAAACGSDERPHSDYFVVGFLADTPALSQPGLEALEHAARQAGRSTPAFIAIEAAVPARDEAPPLTQQRIATITRAFVAEGVDPRLIRSEMRGVDAKSYVARKDGFVLQLFYGSVATK